MTNGADGAHARDGAPTRASRCRTLGANRRRPRERGCGRPRGELDGPRHPRLREPVPAPVELGLGVHRHRLLPLWTRAARRRSCGRSSPASGRNGLLPHIRFARGRAATSRGPSSGRRSSRLSRRATRRRRESSSRRCTQQRCGRSSDTPRTARTPGAFSASSCRSSPPGTGTCTASGRVATTGSWRSGTPGSRAWTTRPSGTTPSRGSGPRPRRSRRTSGWTSSSSTRRAADRRHYDRYAYLVRLYRDRTTSLSGSGTMPFVVRDVLFNSLLVQAESRPRGDLARRGRRSRAVRDLGGSERGRSGEPLGRRRGDVLRLRRPLGDAHPGAYRRRRLAPLCGGSERRPGRTSARGARAVPGRDRRGRPGGRERSGRRPALRSRAVLAGPGVADDQLGRARGPAPVRLRRQGGGDQNGAAPARAARRLLGALQRGHRRRRWHGAPVVDRGLVLDLLDAEPGGGEGGGG